MTWGTDVPPPAHQVPRARWGLVALRVLALSALIGVGLAVHLTLRLIERPLFGLRRPLSPWITQGVCRLALAIIGLRLRVTGRPMGASGALVANHVSWLDIFVLNALDRVYFVAKGEVARWPVIGVLARVTGTVFIRRDRREAARQKLLFEARLRAGQRLLFFPEGTSTDGLRVLPFKSTLFAALFEPGLRAGVHVQPVSLSYRAPSGREARFFGWWGGMDFAGHFLSVLAQWPQGGVEVVFHPPRAVADHAERKALAAACGADIAAAVAARLPEG